MEKEGKNRLHYYVTGQEQSGNFGSNTFSLSGGQWVPEENIKPAN